MNTENYIEQSRGIANRHNGKIRVSYSSSSGYWVCKFYFMDDDGMRNLKKIVHASEDLWQSLDRTLTEILDYLEAESRATLHGY